MKTYFEYSCLLCYEKFCVSTKQLKLMYCPYCGKCLIREKDKQPVIYIENIDSDNIGEDVIFDLGIINAEIMNLTLIAILASIDVLLLTAFVYTASNASRITEYFVNKKRR